MSAMYENAVMIDKMTGKEVAQVALNGTLVGAGATLAHSGRMRTFKLRSGCLHEPWFACRPLRLQQDDQTFVVRIAALPADVGATGFLEFVQ